MHGTPGHVPEHDDWGLDGVRQEPDKGHPRRHEQRKEMAGRSNAGQVWKTVAWAEYPIRAQNTLWRRFTLSGAVFLVRSIMLAIFGLGVGTFGTMLGVGVGWIHVPFLLLAVGFSPQMAIGTSIGIIFWNTLSGSFVYYAQRRLDLPLARRLAPAVLPGALLGPFIVQRFTTSLFFILFSLLLVLIAAFIFGKGVRVAEAAEGPDGPKDTSPSLISRPDRVRIGVLGTLVIGFVSNIFGIGGGILHVPFLILVLGVPTHIALGTSHFILCVSSGVGAVVYYLMGYLNLDYMMPIAIGTILGAPFGARLASQSGELLIRRLLAALLLVLALRMAYTGIQQQLGEVPVIHDIPGHQYMPVPVPYTPR